MGQDQTPLAHQVSQNFSFCNDFSEFSDIKAKKKSCNIVFAINYNAWFGRVWLRAWLGEKKNRIKKSLYNFRQKKILGQWYWLFLQASGFSCSPAQQAPSSQIFNSRWLVILAGISSTAKYYASLYKDHVTNKETCAKIQLAIGPHEDLLTNAKRHMLKWYGPVSHSSGLAKTILQGTVQGGRRQGRQKKKWEDIREWTGLEFAKSQRAVENREKWRKLIVKSSLVPQWPPRLRG